MTKTTYDTNRHLETQQPESQMPTDRKDFSNATNTKRMSISLAGDAAQMLEYLATSQCITQNEALRKSIATEAYLRQEMVQGTKVLLQKPDGEIREVVFR